MAKFLVHDYTFTPAENKIVIDYVYKQERFLIITNVTSGITMFQFNVAGLGFASISYDYALENTTLILDFDCSAMNSADKLQIFIEKDAATFQPTETFTDPVSKFRVSQPENLIDTDFEYGLQSTKWETLELVKNIPTFFSRNGDVGFEVLDITVTTGSDQVLVTLNEDHGLLPGSPVIVQGTDSITCDGTFVITQTPSTTTLRYKAKAAQTQTGTIFDSVSTQVFAGSRYQGTEFTLNNIDTITTNANAASTLTVNTQFPTGFIEGTSFYLTNSVAPVTFFANAATVQANTSISVSQTRQNNLATGESGFTLGMVQPYNYTGTQALYFDVTTLTVDIGADTLTFPTAHGLEDNRPYLYILGENNTGIGLTANTVFYVRVIDSVTIYFTTNINVTSPRVNLTSGGASGGTMRSALLRAYRANGASTGADLIFFTFESTDALLAAVPDRNTPMLMWTTTMGGLNVNSNLFNPTVYYKFDNYTGIGNYIRFSFTPTGGLIQLSTSSASGYMIPAALLEDRDSFFFPNHSLETNEAATITTISGSAPVSNGLYAVDKVNDDRLRLKSASTGALVEFNNGGSQTATYQLTATPATLLNDSITIANHEIPDGTAVVYGNAGNPSIGGLTDGTTYYSFASTADTIKLATTASGYFSAAKAFTQSSFVSTASNFIRLSQTGNHGYSTGDVVQYLSDTPIGGLRSGAFYFVRVLNSVDISLHRSAAGAAANTETVDLIAPLIGTGSVRKSTMVDLTAASTGTHRFSSTLAGASDGVYTLSNAISSTSFELAGNVQIGNREFTINQGTVNLKASALRLQSHFLAPSTSLVYSTTGNALGGLTNGNTYYTIRVNRDYIKLADTSDDAFTGNNITFTSQGDGTQTLITGTITGEVAGTGNVNIANAATTVTGDGTTFNAVFVPGDTFTVFGPEATTVVGVSSINTTTDVITANATTNFTTEDAVILRATAAPGGTTAGFIYYVNAVSGTTFTLHNTPADATANTSIVNMSSAGTSVTFDYITNIGNSFSSTIATVNSTTEIELNSASTAEYIADDYVVGTGLFVRADGFALHRPYDGGVELVPSTNPDSTMIRQTRKYFRYQSGKGIQVSFAVNFSPTVTIDNFAWSNVGGVIVGTISTRFPHRLSTGLTVTINNATVSSGINYWNGEFEIQSIVDANNFTVTLSGTPNDAVALGLPEFYVNNWNNSLLKCGLFDDQNGLYFEYDGNNLNCCRRSSTLQISGTVSVQFKSGQVTGNGTKFTSQLAVGDYIVIKGQSYLITEIATDNSLFILPSYRGVDATRVIVTKTIDTKVPQSQWNIDRCDGTGPSGYYLDIHTIQMAYMDYSWYGAGKVRFGFKDQVGKVIYVHEFIHNNQFTEAYMRSGNLPARYEIENTGQPSFVPALAHWGTSVIMDGRFDDDKAYVFTASSQSISLTGAASLLISGNVETTSSYYVQQGGAFRLAGPAVRIGTANVLFNQIVPKLTITGNGLAASTLTRNPQDSRISPQQPYLAGVTSRIGFSSATTETRNLIVIDRTPSTTAVTNNYTVTLSTASTSVTYEQPLISVRLAPSVDNGAPGRMGSREIINRMQLILNSVGILTTHACEVVLRLNGLLNGYDWQRVTNPSLSQLIFHDGDSRISGGTVVYSFRAQGGSGTSNRTQVLTQQELEEIATLGNAIMGGDNVFPDGPDVLTVTVRLVEDPGFVSASNPWNVTGRISWSESQA